MPNRPLDEIGLGHTPRRVIYLISVLPIVGLVIGLSYATRRNAATRSYGRGLLWYAILLHLVYLFCLCPMLLIWATTS
jgi:hypothetical protein